MIRRQQIEPELGRGLARKVTTTPTSPKRSDIIRYLHTRLDEDTNPDKMDGSLEADILKKIPGDISAM